MGAAAETDPVGGGHAGGEGPPKEGIYPALVDKGLEEPAAGGSSGGGGEDAGKEEAGADKSTGGSAPTTEYSTRSPHLSHVPAGEPAPALPEPGQQGQDIVQGPAKLQGDAEGDAVVGGAPPGFTPARRGTSKGFMHVVQVATSQHLGALQPPPQVEDVPGARTLPNFSSLGPLQKVAAWWGCMAMATRAVAFIFIINVFITFSSQLGWYGATNTELSDKYQTFVTPAGGAFSIWGLIFIAEGIFTIYILFPSQSAQNKILDRIAPPWIVAQLFQIAWTFLFASEILWAALVCMVGIWVSLVVLSMRLDVGRGMADASRMLADADRVHVSYVHWWLYYFGFMVHLGWITAATLVNANVIVVMYNLELTVQIAVAIVSLAAALISALFWVYTRRDAVHSFVISWALYFLGNALNDPTNPLPYGANGTDVVVSLALAVYIVSVIALIVALLGLLMHVVLFVISCTQSEAKVEEMTGWHLDSATSDWTIHNRYDWDPSVNGAPEHGKRHRASSTSQNGHNGHNGNGHSEV